MQTLRAFDAAARHGSYSAAADELGLTHGAISHRIRELEDRMGAPLFRRVGRMMAPTREAVMLLAEVRQALAGLHRAFPDLAADPLAKLVVGVHPALSTWLVPRLSGFVEAHPQTQMEIRSTADIGDFLDTGVDIALRYGAGGWPNVSVEKLRGENLFVVCSPAYRDAHRLERPDDLAGVQLLRHAWQAWSPWLRAAGLTMSEPAAGVIVSDSSMVLEAALAGQGVALARSLMAADHIAERRLVRLFDVEVEDPFGYYAVWRPGGRLLPAAEAFRTWLHEAMAATPVAPAETEADAPRATGHYLQEADRVV